MINTKHLIKVGSAWISITYIICFAGVALWPSLRAGFMRYALHAEVAFSQSFISFSNFIIGFIIWNIIALAGLWLFAFLFNKIKQ